MASLLWATLYIRPNVLKYLWDACAERAGRRPAASSWDRREWTGRRGRDRHWRAAAEPRQRDPPLRQRDPSSRRCRWQTRIRQPCNTPHESTSICFTTSEVTKKEAAGYLSTLCLSPAFLVADTWDQLTVVTSTSLVSDWLHTTDVHLLTPTHRTGSNSLPVHIRDNSLSLNFQTPP